jgi:hypothetical protein
LLSELENFVLVHHYSGGCQSFAAGWLRFVLGWRNYARYRRRWIARISAAPPRVKPRPLSAAIIEMTFIEIFGIRGGEPFLEIRDAPGIQFGVRPQISGSRL